MSEVTQILSQIERGNPTAAEQLLPLIYSELRMLAAAKLAHEKPGQTLQPTALVHEAYLRLVGPGAGDQVSQQQLSPDSCPPAVFDSRGHFFAAASEAMRRILVENARRRLALKRGGQAVRQPLDPDLIAAPELSAELLALDESLDRLAAHDAAAAQLVKLRYFAGLSLAQAALALDISTRSADRLWGYAKAWLYRDMAGPQPDAEQGDAPSPCV